MRETVWWQQEVQRQAADLSDLFIMFIKRLAVSPVEESGDAHNFFLLVDDGQRQDVLNDKTCFIHGFFLRDNEIKCSNFALSSKPSEHKHQHIMKAASCSERPLRCINISKLTCIGEISYVIDIKGAIFNTLMWIKDSKSLLTWKVKYSSAATFIMLQICRRSHKNIKVLFQVFQPAHQLIFYAEMYSRCMYVSDTLGLFYVKYYHIALYVSLCFTTSLCYYIFQVILVNVFPCSSCERLTKPFSAT